jgi:hypothetical protein
MKYKVMKRLTTQCPLSSVYLLFLELEYSPQSNAIYVLPLLTARAQVTLLPYETALAMKRKGRKHL